MTLSHFAQFGSIKTLTSSRLDEERGVADPGDADFAVLSFGNTGSPPAGAPGEERRNEDLVRKLRLCQSRRAADPTRVERSNAPPPFPDAGPFPRAFLGKRNRHSAQPYNP